MESNFENAMNLLREKVEEHNKTQHWDDRRWITAEIHGICKTLFLCNIINAEDWIAVEDLIK